MSPACTQLFFRIYYIVFPSYLPNAWTTAVRRADIDHGHATQRRPKHCVDLMASIQFDEARFVVVDREGASMTGLEDGRF